MRESLFCKSDEYAVVCRLRVVRRHNPMGTCAYCKQGVRSMTHRCVVPRPRPFFGGRINHKGHEEPSAAAGRNQKHRIFLSRRSPHLCARFWAEPWYHAEAQSSRRISRQDRRRPGLQFWRQRVRAPCANFERFLPFSAISAPLRELLG